MHVLKAFLKHKCFFVSLVSFLILEGSVANKLYACPQVPFKNKKEIINPASQKAKTAKKKFIDYNCDQKLEITFVGDSIVYGRGDFDNGNKGGYVIRLQDKFKKYNKKLHVRFNSIGYPGVTSSGLRAKLMKIYKQRRGSTKAAFNKLAMSDIIIFDVGRNDYWDHNPVEYTVNNIRRSIEYLYSILPHLNGSPLVIISSSVLIPVGREYQVPFVTELNKKLRGLKYTRFSHKFDVNLLTGDRLHPSSKGYTVLANSFYSQLINKKTGIQSIMKTQRPDSDQDGIPDLFEISRYGTNHKRKDTDRDELTDFDELYIHETAPDYFDTDGDGYSDGEEVQNGTDPLDSNSPYVTATFTNTPIFTNTPTATRTPTFTSTPTSTPTPTSTNTPTPTPTHTPTEIP